MKSRFNSILSQSVNSLEPREALKTQDNILGVLTNFERCIRMDYLRCNNLVKFTMDSIPEFRFAHEAGGKPK